MDSLAASMLLCCLVAWIGLPGLRRVWARGESRLRAVWTWRNGRERASMRGVIHC